MTDLTLHNLFVKELCKRKQKKTEYDFTKFTFLLKFASKIYRGDLTLQQAKEDQEKLKIFKNVPNNNYNPTDKDKIKEKDATLSLQID